MPASSLTDFVTVLLQEGRALSHGSLHKTRAGDTDLQSAKSVLVEAADRKRLGAPASPPQLNENAALWAAEAFAWACGMLTDRSETNVQLPGFLAETTPVGETASDHWSVDLLSLIHI